MHLGFDCLSPAEEDVPQQRVLHMLDHVGIGVGSAVALDLLQEAGARVEGESHTANLPPEPVAGCPEKAPERVRLAARDPARDLAAGAGSRLACCTDCMATMVRA